MSMLLDGQMPHHRLEAELGDAMRATGLRRTYVDSWESAVLTARGVGTSIPDPAGGLRAVGLSFIGLSGLVSGVLPSNPAFCDLLERDLLLLLRASTPISRCLPHPPPSSKP